MAVRYVYASISENGTVNGKKGDQTGKEVKCAKEYNFGQTMVFHPPKNRIAIASAAMAISKNKNVGYSQADRYSLYGEAEKYGWKKSKVKKYGKCNCDCSMLVTVAFNLAYGKKVLASSNTTKSLLKASLAGLCGKGKKYKKGMKLYKGDIVIKDGHVVIVYKGGTAKV